MMKKMKSYQKAGEIRREEPPTMRKKIATRSPRQAKLTKSRKTTRKVAQSRK